jgi:hypothetical protein
VGTVGFASPLGSNPHEAFAEYYGWPGSKLSGLVLAVNLAWPGSDYNRGRAVVGDWNFRSIRFIKAKTTILPIVKYVILLINDLQKPHFIIYFRAIHSLGQAIFTIAKAIGIDTPFGPNPYEAFSCFRHWLTFCW